MSAPVTGTSSRPRPTLSGLSSMRLNVQDVHARLQEENKSRDSDRGLNLDFSVAKEGHGRRPKPCNYALSLFT